MKEIDKYDWEYIFENIYLDLMNIKVKVIHNTNLIIDLENMLIRSGFTIINKIEHFFPHQGYTGLWLLAESHFAIHTFPEENKIYVEISSCVKKYFDKFIEEFKKYIT